MAYDLNTISPIGEFWGGSLEADIRAAALAANNSGGGVVKIAAKTITLTSPLPVYPNVIYMGAAANEVYYPANGPVAAGTILDCQNMGINAFEWNAVDLGAALTPSGAIHATECYGAGFFNLCIKNAKDGFRFGGSYNGGVTFLQMDNVSVFNCTGWGFWLENCHRPKIGRVQAHACATGGFAMVSSASDFHYGNGVVDYPHVYNNSSRAQNIVIGAKNSSEINNLTFLNVVAAGTGSISTQTASFTNGSADIGVTDLSKFVVGFPVVFTSTVAGFTISVTYFVRAVSGASGAGTIQLALSMAAVIKTATVNATGSIVVRGAAGIVVGALDDSANTFATNIVMLNIDVEQNGIAHLALFSVQRSYFIAGYLDELSNQNQVVMRNCDNTSTVRLMSNIPRFDSDNQFSRVDGGRTLADVFNMPAGFREAVYLGGGKRATFLVSDGTLYPASSDCMTSVKPSYIASGATIGATHTSLVTYTGAGGGNITLPTIAAAICGIQVRVVNPTSGTLTVNLPSGQFLNNDGATTSLVIPARSSAVFQSCREQSSAGNFFWQNA